MDYIYLTGITLFFIMDPLGNIPLFVTILNKVSPERRDKVLRRELLIALIVALAFFFFGPMIVKLLGLEPNAISVGGGVILFIIGLKMIFPEEGGVEKDQEKDEPFIVPLAIPLFVGPSILAMIILIQSRGPHFFWQNLVALIGAWALSAFILMFSNRINKLLGKRGLIATERLMGMLLIIIAVQMLLNGVSQYIQMR